MRGSIQISLVEVQDLPLKKEVIDCFRSSALSALGLFDALLSYCSFVRYFFARELNLFLTEFSVLPGMHFAISLHLFPIDCCFFRRVMSSHSDHESLALTISYHFIDGFT